MTESPYDAFGAGHATTSVSAALGYALARDMRAVQRGLTTTARVLRGEEASARAAAAEDDEDDVNATAAVAELQRARQRGRNEQSNKKNEQSQQKSSKSPSANAGGVPGGPPTCAPDDVGHCIAVIGDGAITGGMAWEAINHAAGSKTKMIIVLNDNRQVSLPTLYNDVKQPVGALASVFSKSANHVYEAVSNTTQQSEIVSEGDAEVPFVSRTGTAAAGPRRRRGRTVARLESSPTFMRLRARLRDAAESLLPPGLQRYAAKADDLLRELVRPDDSKGTLFEEFGTYYVGPVDGHDIATLSAVLRTCKRLHEQDLCDRPIVVHVVTNKGKGVAEAEAASDRMHAVGSGYLQRMDRSAEGLARMRAAEQAKSAAVAEAPAAPPLTAVFAGELARLADGDDRICAITAAMPGGSGVDIFHRSHPERTIDVGIAEPHAVTLAAGLAAASFKPFVCIYSTFLQRAFDQLVHDVALQKLPVRFVVDRAGFVGEDGATHVGSLDLCYTLSVPNMVVGAPATAEELRRMVRAMVAVNDRPSAVRFPRGSGPAYPERLRAVADSSQDPAGEEMIVGRGRVVRSAAAAFAAVSSKPRAGAPRVALLSLGTRLLDSLQAQEKMAARGVTCTVADPRWAKPLDLALVSQLAKSHDMIVTVEEGNAGGFGAVVSKAVADLGLSRCVVRQLTFPDRNIDAGPMLRQLESAGVTSVDIEDIVGEYDEGL